MAAASPLGVPATSTLVADAAAIATRLGLRVDEPVVLKDSLNLLVWLRPSPVVARIHARAALVRAPEAAADSLALASYLAAAGLPVSPPADDVDPGPHVGATGRPMTFWRRLEVDEGTWTASTGGSRAPGDGSTGRNARPAAAGPDRFGTAVP